MEDSSYSGLSDEQKEKIEKEFIYLMNRPLNRLEVFVRRLARAVINHFPGGKHLLSPVRVFHNRLRLKLSGW